MDASTTPTPGGTHLVLDIGNTRTKAGLFTDGALAYTARWTGVPTAAILDWAYNQPITAALLSTSGDQAAELEAALRARQTTLRLDHRLRLPFHNGYTTPETLGRDRLAGVAGAVGRFPGKNCLVIDAGTCITLDLVTAAGNYLGGNISPGIRMRLRAMHAQTAALPLVAPAPTAPALLGVSTETALQNGGQLGAILEIEAFIRRCTAQYPDLHVLMTGGDGEWLGHQLKTKIFALPNLVLLGLHEILLLNVASKS